MVNKKQGLRAFALGAVCLSLVLVGPGFAKNAGKGQTSVVLLAGGIDNVTINQTHVLLATAELFHPRSGRFTTTGSMSFGRTGHTATLLLNHKVLIAGGDSNATDQPFNSAELYDPTNGTFTPTGSMADARVGHAATLLPNGEVLVTGGQDQASLLEGRAELYDPVSGTFHLTGLMSVLRTDHSATLLPNGTVLIAGGSNNFTGVLASAEIYDPATGEFSATGSMVIPRTLQTATLLMDGKVLIAGGGTAVGNCLNCSTTSAELYDPATHAFSSTGSMTTSRRGNTATRLLNGEVLITGGIDDESDCSPDACILDSAELYDAPTQSFKSTSAMTDKRFGHSATLLDDGRVLIAGGLDTRFHITNTADLYTPKSGTFAQTGNMNDARAEQTATGVP
jgi:hypothetical protein